MGRIVGIDLGTTNSEVAVMEAGKPRAITSAEGQVMVPSVVAFTDEGERLVGEPAKRQAVLNPRRTIMEIKRKMGTDYTVTVEDETYTPEQISAMILQKVKRDAEEYLGEEVTDAVITVPAYFDDNQRQATKDAGKIAGLNVRRIINEPTAAAFAYGLDKEEDATLAVWDLGGGTFDITVMEIGVEEEGGVFEVQATNGDTHLGGKDIDDALVDRLVEVFAEEHGVELTEEDPDHREALQRLKDAAETAKIELSSAQTTTVSLPYLLADDAGPKHLEHELRRSELERVARPILERTRGPCRQAMEDAGVGPGDIDHVILVGGTSRMPLVREIVQDIFGQEPERGVDPMECVALGAAIQAGILSGEVDKEMVLLDVTPLTLGVETKGGVMTPLIERNTTIPTKRTKTFTTAEDNQTAVTVHVLQGERPMAADNTSLGNFNLEGIPPARRGVPQIEVTFDIDTDGILNVSAKDKGTGKENTITITGSTKLSDAEIERMQQEAEAHAKEDERRRALAEARNEADSALFSAERTLDEFGDKVDDDLRDRIEATMEDVRKVLDEDDPATIEERTEALVEALQEIGSKVYGQAGGGPEGAGGRGGVGGAAGPGGFAGGAGGDQASDAAEPDFRIKDDEEEDGEE